MKKNTILCLIDFTEASQRELRWATTMASKLNAHLTILHAYRLLQSNTKVLQMKRQTEIEAREKFLKLEEDVLIHNSVEYEFRSEVGFMADRIEDYVSKNLVSMLIIHKSMIHESKESIQQVIDQLKVPLVIVP